MEYRKLKKQDANQVLSLWEKLMKEHTELEPKYYSLLKDARETQEKFLLKSIASPERFFMGCFEEEKLVGYAFGWIEKRPPVLKVDKIGLLHEIFVSKSYRQKGIGKKLAQAFFDWCKSKGVFCVQLIVLEEKDAVDFYHAIGFRNFMKKMLIEL